MGKLSKPFASWWNVFQVQLIKHKWPVETKKINFKRSVTILNNIFLSLSIILFITLCCTKRFMVAISIVQCMQFLPTFKEATPHSIVKKLMTMDKQEISEPKLRILYIYIYQWTQPKRSLTEYFEHFANKWSESK